MQKITNIIFDFDGVLIDSFEFHRKKIEEFAKIELSINDYKNLHD
jgi:beta-phosphoglucomutase-like phosphatase (HAD superfamily)